MFIKLFLIAIILYIIIKQLIDSNQNDNKLLLDNTTNKSSGLQQKQQKYLVQPQQIRQQQNTQQSHQQQIQQDRQPYQIKQDIQLSQIQQDIQPLRIQQDRKPSQMQEYIYQPQIQQDIQPQQIQQYRHQPPMQQDRQPPIMQQDRQQLQMHSQQQKVGQQQQIGQSTRSSKSDLEEFSNYEVQEFDRPYPWTKIIHINGEEYPYIFHIKVVIPSLNDFERWKQIIPNIDFNPNTRELIIPSKDEASALALANLICINFSGQMTIQNILDKDLIRISITKAKSYDVVKNKLRDQIMEVLYGKSFSTVQTNYEKDLAKNGIEDDITPTIDVSKNTTSLKSENFRDTFQHFSNTKSTNENEIGAYDNSTY